MLSITVDNQKRYIAKGTSIQMEMQNAAFNTAERIEGDIIFTFELPVKPNEVLFNHAQYVYVNRLKKYRCIISVGGFDIAEGDLYLLPGVKTYTCSVVMNPYTKGFAAKKLKDNDYGDDLIISEDYSVHNQRWIEFLKSTKEESSHIRFPLFVNEEMYSENDDFGFFKRESEEGTLENFPAIITGYAYQTPPEEMVSKYVNRLFFENGEVVEAYNYTRGIRVFNDGKNFSSFCFAPAFHLLWLLKLVLKNAGYTLVGNFMDDDFVKKIIYQSMKAMDGSTADYDIYSCNVSKQNDYYNQYPDLRELHLGYEIYLYKYTSTDDNNFSLFQQEPPPVGAYPNFIPYRMYPKFPAIHQFYINLLIKGSYTVDYRNDVSGLETWRKMYVWLSIGLSTGFQVAEKDFGIAEHSDIIYYHSSSNSINNSWFDLNFSVNFPDYVAEDGFSLRLYAAYVVIKKQNDIYTYETVGVDHECTAKISFDKNAITPGNIPNIFSKKLIYADHQPDLTNSEFVNAVCSMFGLSFFIDSKLKRIELSFFRDILNAKEIDLSGYTLVEETKIGDPNTYLYKYMLPSITDEKINEKKINPEVKSFDNLPNPFTELGKYCFVEDENRFYKAVRTKDDDENTIYEWQYLSGNQKYTQVGSADDELSEIKPHVKVPTVKKISNYSLSASDYDNIYLPEINSEGVSDLLDSEENEFDMVLMRYNGLQDCVKKEDGTWLQVEHATPIDYNIGGVKSSDTTITPEGENSVAEIYAQPWLKFIGNYEPVTCKFLLPLHKFMEVIKLLKPQDAAPKDQVRWIFCENSRMMPIQMNFEFSNSDMILAEIKMAKPIIEA